jgi:N-acetylglucosaminyl-diphospho-decaprenol L-rhamnosyltransferase
MSDREGSPALSVVVLSWNTESLLRACLASLRADAPRHRREVIVVDNYSTRDSSADMVAREFPEMRLIRNAANQGYAEGNNVGIRAARGRHVLLLNSDTEVEAGALDHLVDFLDANPDHGAVSAQLRNFDGTIQRACMRWPDLLVCVGFDTWFGRHPLARWIDRYFCRDFDHEHSRDVEQPPGAALLLRRSALELVGLLDPDLFLFFNDVELCRRLHRAGYAIHFLATARIRHHGGASTSRYGEFALEWHKNRARYYLREHGRFGFALAKAMTAWRAMEEWWRSAWPCEKREDRAQVGAGILRVVREVWNDEGRDDPRVARSASRD